MFSGIGTLLGYLRFSLATEHVPGHFANTFCIVEFAEGFVKSNCASHITFDNEQE